MVERLEQIIRHMQLPGAKGGPSPPVFIVGTFARRVTIYSQQVRATNLVYALLRTGRLNPDDRVIVIGAGAAGMTAAAAAAAVGARVQLYDRHAELMATQLGCRHRWVHPQIYNWPQPGSLDDRAELPWLPWSAGTAHEVRRQILAGWEAIQVALATKSHRSIEFHGRSQIVQVESGAEPTILWKSASGKERRELCDVLILTLGFGRERQGFGVELPRYWTGDDLEQLTSDRQQSMASVLISGAGDGGLIEVLRARLVHFDHDKLPKILGADDLQPLRERLLAIDLDPRSDQPRELHHWYDQLEVPASLASALPLRQDIRVYFHTQTQNWLSKSASIMNRFLVHYVLRDDSPLLAHRTGELSDGCLVRSPTASQFQVTLPKQPPFFVDRVYLRHGAESEYSFEPFRSLLQTHESHFRSLAEIDTTHLPQWTGDEAFATRERESHVRDAPPPTATIPATDALRDPAKPLARTILFSDLCRADYDSVAPLAEAAGDFEVEVAWHPAIRGALAAIDRMKLDLDVRLRALQRASPSVARATTGVLKSGFLDALRWLRELPAEIARGRRTLQAALTNAEAGRRLAAWQSFAGFAALMTVRRISAFNGFLVDEEGRFILEVIADVPQRRDWVYSSPYADPLAFDAFALPAGTAPLFLSAKVGARKLSVATISMPFSDARTYLEYALPEEFWYDYALPQWVLLEPRVTLPTPDAVKVWSYSDAEGRTVDDVAFEHHVSFPNPILPVANDGPRRGRWDCRVIDEISVDVSATGVAPAGTWTYLAQWEEPAAQ